MDKQKTTLQKLISEFLPELQLMLASANNDLDKTKSLIKQPVNWDKFLRLADNHRVYPLVYKTLSLLDNLLIPEYVLEALKQKCQDNALNALRTTGEMVRILGPEQRISNLLHFLKDYMSCIFSSGHLLILPGV